MSVAAGLVYLIEVKEDIPNAYKAWVELMLQTGQMCSNCKSQMQIFPSKIDLYLQKRIKSAWQSCGQGSGMIFHKDLWQLIQPHLHEQVALGRVFAPSGRTGEWARRTGEQFRRERFKELTEYLHVTVDGSTGGLDLYDVKDGKSRQTGACSACVVRPVFLDKS